jgi:hypothetical protein
MRRVNLTLRRAAAVGIAAILALLVWAVAVGHHESRAHYGHLVRTEPRLDAIVTESLHYGRGSYEFTVSAEGVAVTGLGGPGRTVIPGPTS